MVSVCVPTASPLAVHGLLHVVAAAESRLQVTVAVASLTAKLTVASVAVLVATGPLVTVTMGGAQTGGGGGGGLTVQLWVAVPVPLAFVAWIVRVWPPMPRLLAVNGLLHVPTRTPSSTHVTA